MGLAARPRQFCRSPRLFISPEPHHRLSALRLPDATLAEDSAGTTLTWFAAAPVEVRPVERQMSVRQVGAC
jgi:hypothetical protein